MPPKTEAQFPLWTATDSLCRRYSVDLASPVSDVILRPTSFSSAKDLEIVLTKFIYVSCDVLEALRKLLK